MIKKLIKVHKKIRKTLNRKNLDFLLLFLKISAESTIF